MKKALFILGCILATIVAIRFIGGNEDTWLCENGGWVRHGNPTAPMPSGGCPPSSSPSASVTISATPSETVEQAMIQALAEKYNRDKHDVELTVSKNEGGFARGSVRFAGEMGGALWFGAVTDEGWVLVHDAQGPLECTIAEKYQLPQEFAPECIDADGNLQQRK